jgi:hypothetical protein
VFAVTQKENRTSAAGGTGMPGVPTEMFEKGIEAASNMQKELLSTIEEANREWLARMELERNLASELTSKLTSARSAPEAAAAYQEWMARRVQLMGEDSRKFVADCQKFVNATMRTFGNGWSGGST